MLIFYVKDQDLPKPPRPLTPGEIKELEEALQTVCGEIEKVLEERRLEESRHK